jgi:hypothetical protein
MAKVALETEVTNTAAMKLYERLGFLRSKRLHRYYLNGNSAYRLVLYLKEGVGSIGMSYGIPLGMDPNQLPMGYQDAPLPVSKQENGQFS